MFSSLSKKSLIKAALFKNTPIYVQFYITARCNLTCQQCNIIYANSDVRECTLEEIKRIADNLKKLGVAIVLLTGGEPFVREDLPEIIMAFENSGIHVRMQTNGLATEEQIQKVVEFGGRDISISLDSLTPGNQDEINGGFRKSWHAAIKTMSLFTKYLPSEGSFASLGCVLQRDNLHDIVDVIKFGSAISWYTSLVPVHVTDNYHPMNFRTFDQSQRFVSDEYPMIDEVIEQVRQMRKDGYLLYDSDQYLDDIKRFVRDEPTTWRSKNDNVCDSPNLYFALLPNGSMSPCCDHRISSDVYAYSPDFPKVFNSKELRDEVYEVTSKCPGCMYGSYPEMTISMRYMAAKIDRIKLFLTSPIKKNWPLDYEEMVKISENILKEKQESVKEKEDVASVV